MERFWEFYIFIAASVALLCWILGEIFLLWFKRHQQWRKVKPHYGSVYDATVKGDLARPNVDLRRTR